MTGAEPKAARAERSAARRSGGEASFQVQLEHGRWRHFGWVLVGAVGGALLLWKLGAVGKALGIVLLGMSAANIYRFARTLLHPAGRIEIGDDSIVLPDGLCQKEAHTVSLDQVSHAYFLRRAVPWARTGPILMIETGEQVFTYPRDWFSSDSDQRRIALALNRRLGRL
ncbi:MAG TPA: hypothetical protein VK698_35305 [Kofleriaceae bacterium]|nr:hypothetical protein [Kofleriaceae bacterium]